MYRTVIDAQGQRQLIDISFPAGGQTMVSAGCREVQCSSPPPHSFLALFPFFPPSLLPFPPSFPIAPFLGISSGLLQADEPCIRPVLPLPRCQLPVCPIAIARLSDFPTARSPTNADRQWLIAERYLIAQLCWGARDKDRNVT